MALRTKNADQLISYRNLRRLIGVLGMCLPLTCYLGGAAFARLGLQPSISAYYHTNVRDAFVGLMLGVSMFLATYNGYERIDSIVSKATAAAGFLVAIFPCLASKGATAPVGFFQVAPGASNAVHIASAGLFFALLAFNSIFLFTLTEPGRKATGNKRKRNAVYVGCGAVILACLVALLALSLAMAPEDLDASRAVFWLETVMLLAFGTSWLVKGETLFRDGRRP